MNDRLAKSESLQFRFLDCNTFSTDVMISSAASQSRCNARKFAKFFFGICIGCTILTVLSNFRRLPVANMSEQEKFFNGKKLGKVFDENSPDILIGSKQARLRLLDYLKEHPLITIGTKLYRVIKVNNTSDESIETRSAVFLDEKAESTDETSSSTLANSFIDFILEGKPAICNGCLSGKKMVAVQYAWICGQTRLGNKLSMIAAAYIAALNQKADFVFIHNGTQTCEWVVQLREIFPNLRKLISVASNLVASWPVRNEKVFTSVQKIEIDGNLTVAGYRQTWEYYPSKSDMQALRTLFTVNDKYRAPAIKRLEKAANSFNVSMPIYIGVHMRMGDLLEANNIKYGYQMANESYYQRAFSLMLEKVIGKELSNRSIFAIATDSVNESKKLLAKFSSSYNLFWLEQSHLVDFATLTLCNHIIISGGTYGFWAAALNGGGTVIYHDNFGKLNTTFGAIYCSRCFNRPDWTPL